MNWDSVFRSLADHTRRDILRRVSRRELSIGTLARRYRMSFAAVAKHVQMLELARLVKKRRAGKKQMISIRPQTVEAAQVHLAGYERLWQERFDALDKLLISKK